MHCKKMISYLERLIMQIVRPSRVVMRKIRLYEQLFVRYRLCKKGNLDFPVVWEMGFNCCGGKLRLLPECLPMEQRYLKSCSCKCDFWRLISSKLSIWRYGLMRKLQTCGHRNIRSKILTRLRSTSSKTISCWLQSWTELLQQLAWCKE